LVAELGIGDIFMATSRTFWFKWRGALITKLSARWIFMLALATLHPALPRVWGRDRLRYAAATL
jgi:hypothetical protein